MLRLRYLCALPVCLALAACGQEAANNALDTVGTETSATINKIRSMTGLETKKPPATVNNVQPRYCYHVYEDIICYGKPIPGYENRLVAYQTTHGSTGYTLEPAATPLEAAALPPLKSVNVNPPPAVKADTSQLKEVIFDPSDLQPKQLVPDKQE